MTLVDLVLSLTQPLRVPAVKLLDPARKPTEPTMRLVDLVLNKPLAEPAIVRTSTENRKYQTMIRDTTGLTMIR